MRALKGILARWVRPLAAAVVEPRILLPTANVVRRLVLRAVNGLDLVVLAPLHDSAIAAALVGDAVAACRDAFTLIARKPLRTGAAGVRLVWAASVPAHLACAVGHTWREDALNGMLPRRVRASIGAAVVEPSLNAPATLRI